MDRRSLLKMFGFVGGGAALGVFPAEPKPSLVSRIFRRQVVPRGAFFNKSYLAYVHRLVEAKVNEDRPEPLDNIATMDEVLMREIEDTLGRPLDGTA